MCIPLVALCGWKRAKKSRRKQKREERRGKAEEERMLMGLATTSPSPSPSSPYSLSPAVRMIRTSPPPPPPPRFHNPRRVSSSIHVSRLIRAPRSFGDGGGVGFSDVDLPWSSSLGSKPSKSVFFGTPPTHVRCVGACRASQFFDLFPSVCSEVVVRDARLEDCWEVADTHCSSFFPNYTFPLDLVLRIDRFVALLSGFSVPTGCTRACLVAVTGCSIDNSHYFGSEEINIGGFEGKFSLNRGSVSGILTVDTVADFLPRKGLFGQRRTGIAYISNVAVQESQRRKGIAKRLIAKAEARARSWGCRAIALHCDASNLAAARLYKGQGFRSISVPKHANWPQPNASPGTQFTFMMKLLTYSGSCDNK